ncbi:MAG: hypothetical protein ABIB61_02570 [Candidatus Shapirobacteria bacterium]
MRIKNKIYIILFLIIQSVCWLTLHCSLTDKKLAMNQIEQEAGVLKQEQERLDKEIAQYSSLLSVRQRAQGLGLVKEPPAVVLSTSQVTAAKD